MAFAAQAYFHTCLEHLSLKHPNSKELCLHKCNNLFQTIFIKVFCLTANGQKEFIHFAVNDFIEPHSFFPAS